MTEKARAGLRAAKALGRKGWRRPVVPAEKLQQTHLAAGLTVQEAAVRLRIRKTALYEVPGRSSGP